MLRISRLTDYGIVLMRYMAACPGRPYNAAEIAAGAHLPPPTASKLLRRLAKHGLLTSHRGASGGYSLSRDPGEISVAEMVRALERPIALTTCTVEIPLGECQHEPVCPVRGHWQHINWAIRAALDAVTLADLAAPLGPGSFRAAAALAAARRQGYGSRRESAPAAGSR